MPIALINLGSPEPPLTIMYSLTSESSKSDRGLSWRGEHKHYDVPGQSVSYRFARSAGRSPRRSGSRESPLRRRRASRTRATWARWQAGVSGSSSRSIIRNALRITKAAWRE